MFGRKKREEPVGRRATDEPVSPEHGPHDRSAVDDVAVYYSELGHGHLDLGAMVIGVPPGRDLNVALDQTGQPEFHVVSEIARVIPHVYAAPRSAGQWRSWVSELSEQLEAQGADVSIVDGDWGREISAELPGAVFRVIGVDGERWMAEVRVMSAPEVAKDAAAEAREIMRHLLVHRGNDPMPVREHLPISVPDEVQQALVQAQSQLAAQQQAQAYQQQMAAGQAPAQAPAQPDPAATEAAAEAPADGGPSEPSARREGSAMDRLRSDSDDL